MSEQTEKLYKAMFALEDIRELLRESVPDHELDEEQQKRLEKALGKAKDAIDSLERWGK